MAQDVCILVNAEDRARLAAIAGDRSRPHKHVLRARIILFAAERLAVLEVARRSGVSRPTVWRWQRRFAETGVDGLLREKPRIPGKPPLPRATVERVVTLTCAAPPGEATHWSGRTMARAVGIGLSSVQRIWKAHGLQPHRIRTFKRSRDPAFADKLRDIDLRLVVSEVLKLIRSTLPSTIEIRQKIGDDPAPVLADASQIHQVVMNLCANASQAMEAKGGLLEVSLGRVRVDEAAARRFGNIQPGVYHRLGIRDTGHGIERAVLERIFEPFYRARTRGRPWHHQRSRRDHHGRQRAGRGHYVRDSVAGARGAAAGGDRGGRTRTGGARAGAHLVRR